MLSDFGDICPFISRDMGYFSEYLKEYGIPESPLPGPHKKEGIYKNVFNLLLHNPIITPFDAFEISRV